MIAPRAVVSLLTCLEAHGIPYWLDGGIGVDALLGSWSREHSDLDLVIPLAQAAEARRALGTLGLTHVTDGLPPRLAGSDGGNRRVDPPPLTFRDEGGGGPRAPGARPFP